MLRKDFESLSPTPIGSGLDHLVEELKIIEYGENNTNIIKQSIVYALQNITTFNITTKVQFTRLLALLWLRNQGCKFRHQDGNFLEAFPDNWRTVNTFRLQFTGEEMILEIVAVDGVSITIRIEFWKNGLLIKSGVVGVMNSLLPDYAAYSSQNYIGLLEEYTFFNVLFCKNFLIPILLPLSEGRTLDQEDNKI